MVQIKSPLRLRDFRCKLGILFSTLIGECLKKELFDTEKMIVINLKREKSIVLVDSDDNLWELSKNRRGRYNLRKLKGRRYESKA